MAGDSVGVSATIKYKLEKYDEAGNLVEVIEGEDQELGPEESKAMAVLGDTLPDRALEG